MKTYFLPLLLFLFGMSSVMAQDVFFSEDFDQGLPNTWKSIKIQGNTTPSASWIWTRTGPQGSFPTPSLRSTTASNGWMIFDSDLNCRLDAQEVWLMSPRLSGTGKDVVFLNFQTLYRTFNDVVTIEVSRDSMNWTSIEVFPDLTANDFGGDNNPELVNINISDVAAGAEQFWFAFRFLSDANTNNGGQGFGCGYNWQVDDVELSSTDPRAPNNLAIVSNSFGIAPNLFTPASQVEPFGFIADIENIGSADQVEVNLNLSIQNNVTDAIVFEEDVVIELLKQDSTTSVVFTNQFSPEPEQGIYFGTYSLTLSGNDADTTDNVSQFAFAVSDTIFSKFINITGGLAPASSNSYAYGNCFYVPKGEGFFGRYVTFAVSNADELTDRSITILTYKWDGDLNGDLAATPNEYGNQPIAFNGYTFTGDETGFITVPMSLDEVGIPLENDAYYFVVIQYETNDQQVMFTAISDEFDYTNMFLWSVFVNDSPRYASVLDVGNTGDYDLIGFGLDVVPAVDMSIGNSPDLVSSVLPKLSNAHKIEITPNPATEYFVVNFDLATSQEVSLRLLDVQGKVIQQTLPQRIQQESLRFNTSHLAAGTYFLYVAAEEGVRSLTLQVKK
ncbi:MAG: T9SS type A sorting domain-containing protein [Saprospiraceae bacterium]|nr:T9SS type A sorting domain-containing protein [Saprospiraceae bacterium]